MTERWRSRLKSTPRQAMGATLTYPGVGDLHGPPTSSRRGWHVQTYLGAWRLVVRQVSGSHLSPEGYRFPGTPVPIIPGPSPAGDRAGCPGGLAERSAAPTEASLACVSHWKTAPVPSRRPTVAGRSRPWSCVCLRPLQDHGDRARGDPALAPPPRVPQRGMASTPPQAPATSTSPHAPRGARASIDNTSAHATIRAPHAQRLRCGLCRCGGAPVRAGPRLVHRATRRQRARRTKEIGCDPGDEPPEHAALRAPDLDL